MKNARTVTDLDSAFHKRVVNLVQEYDYQKLQAQTFADYMVALVIAYEQENARLSSYEVGGDYLVNRGGG